MASQSEVGHARNVANVRKLIHHIPWTHKKNHLNRGGFIIINLLD